MIRGEAMSFGRVWVLLPVGVLVLVLWLIIALIVWLLTRTRRAPIGAAGQPTR